jgi:hypothetical protein
LPISSDIARSLNKELDRLKEERAQLDEVISGLEKTLSVGGVRKSTPKRQAAAKPGGPRKPGKRQQQALDLIKDEPGITPPVLTEKMGIKGPAIYPVLKSLTEAGQIEKDGKGYKLSDSPAAEKKAEEEAKPPLVSSFSAPASDDKSEEEKPDEK